MGEAGFVQGFSQGGDAPVHHVGRRDDVGAGFRLADRCLGKERQRRVVVDFVAA